MKKATLTLTVCPLGLSFSSGIPGNIDHILESLGDRLNTRNVLVDMRSFRGLPGRFEMETCEGTVCHDKTLDTLSAQSGTLMLRPGECVSFSLEESYVIVYNEPRENGAPYLHHGIFRGPLIPKVARQLEAIRAQFEN